MKRAFDSTSLGIPLTDMFHLSTSPRANIDLQQCENPCPTLAPNSTFFITYFFYEGTIQEVFSDTYLTWRDDGAIYDIDSADNIMFPGVPHGITAAMKVDGADTEVVLFKGLQYYLYNLNTKVLTDLGVVDVCL